MLIPLAEYAKMHGREPVTARQMARRGGFQTARKMGRDWVIDDREPYPDHRVKSGEYRGWREAHRKSADQEAQKFSEKI